MRGMCFVQCVWCNVHYPLRTKAIEGGYLCLVEAHQTVTEVGQLDRGHPPVRISEMALGLVQTEG